MKCWVCTALSLEVSHERTFLDSFHEYVYPELRNLWSGLSSAIKELESLFPSRLLSGL